MRNLAAGLPGGFRRALPAFGAWSSPRHWRLHGPLRSRRYHGRSSQAVDPAQDAGEQRPRHRHLGELEDHVPRGDDPGADLHQLRSSMTLFSLATDEEETVFRQAIDRCCDGRADERTLALLGG